MIILMMSALLAGGTPDLTHSVAINRTAGSARADYTGALAIRTEQRGTTFGPRPSTVHCYWQAYAQVSRSMNGAPTSAHLFPMVPIASGVRPAGCLEAHAAIRADAARHHHKVGQVLMETASRDKATLEGRDGAGKMATVD